MVVLFVFLSNVRSTLIIGTAIPFSIITTFYSGVLQWSNIKHDDLRG